MAILLNKDLLGLLKGQLGNLVIKQYKNKVVVTTMPAKQVKKNRKPSALKKLYESNFTAAVAYARAILADPKKKAAYEKKVGPGQRVYNYAIAEYAKKYGPKKGG
ncbi:MAG: hypothetical protein EOO53_19915 [Gammaproteobacteria bacterium]|nr:MAG: hypothetical protein EOO53_19915 [Gammaproteobacteria bacterium]